VIGKVDNSDRENGIAREANVQDSVFSAFHDCHILM
jgi:hypothetical protein